MNVSCNVLELTLIKKLTEPQNRTTCHCIFRDRYKQEQIYDAKLPIATAQDIEDSDGKVQKATVIK